MKKASHILGIIMMLFFILDAALVLSLSIRTKVQSIFQTRISLAGKGEFGSIYKMKAHLIPGDSIVEYVWGNAPILTGHIRPLGRTPDQIRQDFDDFYRKDATEAVLITQNTDSVLCYSYMYLEKFPIFIFNNYHKLKSAYIFKVEIPPQNEFSAALYLLNGSKSKFDVRKYYLKTTTEGDSTYANAS